MLVEFSKSLRKHFETRLREKKYMVDIILLEFDMSVSQTLMDMKEARDIMLKSMKK